MELVILLSLPLAGALLLALFGERRWAPELNVAISFLTFVAGCALTARVIADGPMLALEEQFFIDPFNVFLVALTAFVKDQEMAAAAEAQDYELAAVYRDRLRALTYVQGSQTVHSEGLGDADIFALACKSGTMCIQAFFIRGGQNWGHRAFFPSHIQDSSASTKHFRRLL